MPIGPRAVDGRLDVIALLLPSSIELCLRAVRTRSADLQSGPRIQGLLKSFLPSCQLPPRASTLSLSRRCCPPPPLFHAVQEGRSPSRSSLLSVIPTASFALRVGTSSLPHLSRSFFSLSFLPAPIDHAFCRLLPRPPWALRLRSCTAAYERPSLRHAVLHRKGLSS